MSAKDIVKQSSPAIVRIESGEVEGPDHKLHARGIGTGFIVDKSGMIATNLHVICCGQSAIRVVMNDESKPRVLAVVGLDPSHDLALLRIEAKKPLPTLKLGDSTTMSAGDQVFAIGNPLGFNDTVSGGLLSNVIERENLRILQISAPISPGSSGGPLFNQFGEVIGVTTMLAPNALEAQNINFAVPVEYLRPLIAQPIAMTLDEFAKATRGEERSKAHTDDDDDTSAPDRHVPKHPLAIWDGCKPKDIEDTINAITSAIQIGAPAYNKMTPQGFEECFRIYEGTALKLEQGGACKGVRAAFGDGLLKANTVKSFKDKAWALRDTFDGLIEVAVDWCINNKGACPSAIKQQIP
jgi:S1-C subfamily serine protease